SAVKEQPYRCAGIQSLRNADPMLQPKFQQIGVRQPVFFPAITQGLKGDLTAQHAGPMNASYKCPDIVGTIACRIESADETAHTCSGYIVHRDVVRLQPCDRADMRKAKCTAAF